MSERRKIELHRRGLDEIREIMSSMRSLAYIETHKLARRLSAQMAVVATIEAAARDVLRHGETAVPEPESGPGGPPILLVIGSERGFCGDLNHALARRLARDTAAASSGTRLIAVGRKLAPLFDGDARVAAAVDGPGSVEEVDAALTRIVAAIDDLQPRGASSPLTAVYHSSAADGVLTRALLPAAFDSARAEPEAGADAPVLNVAARELLLEITEHYVFSALHEILLAALLAENQRRVVHLEGAVRHLDERVAKLARRQRALRQEEIIEEIEVIMLSAGPVR
jgi:F-type H+-transporting ATPase subunit gamma